MKEFWWKQWNKTTFFKHLKEHCIAMRRRLRKVSNLRTRYCLKSRRHRPCSLSGMRFPVTTNIAIDCHRRTSLLFSYVYYLRWPMCKAWEIAAMKTTEAGTPFIKSHRLHTKSLETLWWLSVPKIVDIVSYLLKFFKNVTGIWCFWNTTYITLIDLLVQHTDVECVLSAYILRL